MKRAVDNIGNIVVFAIIVMTVIFLVAPIVLAGVMSFDARSYLGPFPPPEWSTRWYERFFSQAYIMRGLQTSLLVAAIATVVSGMVGTLTAFALDRYDFPGKQTFAALFLAPLVIPAVVIGFALLLFLSQMNIDSGLARLAAGHIIITAPYTIRTTLASMVGIKSSLSEAAMSLGATEQQAFWTVTFPLARTGIFAGMLFAFAISMDDVAVSLFLTSTDHYTLPIALISLMRANFDLTIAAGAVLLIAVSLLVILLLHRFYGLDRLIGTGVYRSS